MYLRELFATSIIFLHLKTRWEMPFKSEDFFPLA